MASLSAIIPTVATDLARLTLLRRSMLSALHQLGPGDELIVAADTTDGPLDDVRELCGRLGAEAPEGACVRYVPHAGAAHSYGHEQINAAMAVARGEYLVFSDDDDVWAAGAFQAIRDAADELTSPKPLLFRFKSYHGPTFWLAPGVLGKSLIGGHCIVAPNLPSLLGHWGAPQGYEGPLPYYEGDWTFIATTLALWASVGVEPVWCDRLIAIARPS